MDEISVDDTLFFQTARKTPEGLRGAKGRNPEPRTMKAWMMEACGGVPGHDERYLFLPFARTLGEESFF
jgi:hypothetical protein